MSVTDSNHNSSSTLSQATRTLIAIKTLSRRFAGFVILAIALVLALLVVATGPTAEPREQVERSWPVTTFSAEPQTLSPTLLSFGRVEAQQTASLNTTITARVDSVFVREGDCVSKGDLLLALDPSESQFAESAARARLQRSEASLESLKLEFSLAQKMTEANRSLAEVAEATLARAQELHSKRMIADAQLDSAKREASQGDIALLRHLAEVDAFPARLAAQSAAVAEARAELDRALFDLEQTNVRAPFDGRVIDSPFSVGQRVLAGTSLLRIADYSTLEIRSTLPAATAGKLERRLRGGETLTATAEIDGSRLRFELARIGGAVKTGQGGLDAFFSIPASTALEIGSVVDLALELPAELNVLAMPVYSLYEDSTVYRVHEERLQALRFERVGDYLDADGNFLALVRIDGIAPGDSLLGSQLARAITGLLVSPIPAETTQI